MFFSLNAFPQGEGRRILERASGRRWVTALAQEKTKAALVKAAFYIAIPRSRLEMFLERVALTWEPVCPQRGPYTGRGARTDGLVSDRTRD